MQVECTERTVRLFRTGQNAPLVTHHADTDRRPYLHPLLAPDGNGVLTEDAPPHHPWQHGLYVGLNAVNGIGFWTERPEDGSFHPEPITPPTVEDNQARWTVRTAWRAPDGGPVLTEEQEWTFTDTGETYTLDLDWRLRAEVDLTFGQYAYGGLFLRMPYREETGGIAVNSEGQENQAAEAQRARWVAVSMPIEGRADPAGIAIMDHPTNPEYPVPWRVDGQLGIAPSRCIVGSWRLRKGQTAVFRHRVLVFCGAADAGKIETSWNAFAGGLA